MDQPPADADRPSPAQLGIPEVVDVHASRRASDVDEHDVTTRWGERATIRIWHDPGARPREDVLAAVDGVEGLRRPQHVGRTTASQVFVVLPPGDRSAADDLAAGRLVGEFAALNPTALVVEALAAVHERGVVHGRISPASLVWTSGSPIAALDGVPLLDGLPWVALPPPDPTTDDIELPESAFYASPQRLGVDRLAPAAPSPADDVFSIAGVIQARASGQPPAGHLGMSPTEFGTSRLRPIPVCDQLPTRTADLLRAAMSWDPRDRPTAAELAARMWELADPLER